MRLDVIKGMIGLIIKVVGGVCMCGMVCGLGYMWMVIV